MPGIPDDFLNKPLDPEELLVCLKTAERILALETHDLALFALAKLAESRDSETGAHIERVQSYTRLLARNLSEEVRSLHGVDDEYVRLLYQTTPLHDLGKVGIPDAVLLKPGKLTPAEFAIMKTHTILGAQTLDAALERFPNTRFLQFGCAKSPQPITKNLTAPAIRKASSVNRFPSAAESSPSPTSTTPSPAAASIKTP